MATRYALEREGEGWSEVTEPVEGGEYEAYRKVCTDPNCSAVTGPGLIALSGHSHIVEEAAAGPWSSVLDEAPS